ncbi:MAG TPA: CAP domain-containing protein [Candidatus Saccharimonadales bacterium]
MVLAPHPKQHKPTAHDKKRYGQHHKPNKHFSQAYWPYLPMLLVVLSGFILNLTWHAGSAVLGYATNVSPNTLLQQTNIQRTKSGETALALNDELTAAAQAKANDMAKHNYWSHVTPDGKQPWQFIASAGYSYQSAGENLAYGFDNSSATVAGWMNSPTHRANILNNNYQDVGFGIANAPSYQGGGEETIIVAMYGQPQTVVSPSIVKNGSVTPSTQPAIAETAPLTNQANNTSTTAGSDARQITTRNVSRIDILTDGNAQWAAMVLAVLATLAVIHLLLTHARVWRRYLLKGEMFFIKHPLLDTAFVALGVLGYVLTRTTGFIQ